MSDDLGAAFETARYRVFIGDGSHVLAIGAPCPQPIATWISRHASGHCAWLVTAHNPNAEQIDAERNRARHTLLRAWATRRAGGWLETVNEDPDNHWPDEPGVLAIGIDEGEVRAQARRFGQAAIVAVPAEGPVTLVWL